MITSMKGMTMDDVKAMQDGSITVADIERLEADGYEFVIENGRITRATLTGRMTRHVC